MLVVETVRVLTIERRYGVAKPGERAPRPPNKSVEMRLMPSSISPSENSFDLSKTFSHPTSDSRLACRWEGRRARGEGALLIDTLRTRDEEPEYLGTRMDDLGGGERNLEFRGRVREGTLVRGLHGVCA